MSLCIAQAAGETITIAALAFSLGWTHSVEKTEWREEWRIEGAALRLTEARVKGSGAGMEPGEGARLKDGWWVWTPAIPPVDSLTLAASGATGAGWRLCANGRCREIGTDASAPLTLAPCG